VCDDVHLFATMRGWRFTRASSSASARASEATTAGWDVRSDDHAVGEIGLLDQKRWSVAASGACTDFVDRTGVCGEVVEMDGLGEGLVEDGERE
jgi:hypothetical protein